MLSSAAFAMAGSASLARSTISASLSRSSISSGLCHIRGARSVPVRRRTSREQEHARRQRKCAPFPPPSSSRPCSSSSSHWCRPNHPGASRRSPSWASARRRPPLRGTFKTKDSAPALRLSCRRCNLTARSRHFRILRRPCRAESSAPALRPQLP